MKNMKKVPWHIIISAMILTMLVLATSKVFAHGESQCFTDTDGNVRLSNDGWVKIVRHLQGDDLKGYAHGHQKQYYDKHGEPTLLSTGFFDEDGVIDDGEFYADFPTAPPPPPQPETVYEMVVVDGVPQHPDTDSPDDVNGVNNEGYNEEAQGFIGIVHTHGYTNEDNVDRYNKHHHKNIVIVDGDYVYEDSSHDSLPVNGEGYDDLIEELEVPTPEPDTVEPPRPTTPPRPTPTPTPTPTTTTRPVSIVPVPTDDMTEEQKDIVEEIIETPPEVVEEVVEDVRFEYGQWYSGINLVSFPVLPHGVETIADLFAKYELFQPFEIVSEEPFVYTGDAIMTIIDGEWVSYGGEADNPVGDIVIAPYMGFALLLDYAAWIAMHGRRLVGDGEFELQLGTGLIGITEPPIVIAKPSDFLLIDGVCAVISRVITDFGRDKQWYLIARVGDPGDEYPVELGDAYLIVSTQEGTIEFEQDMDIPSAPLAPRVDNMTTSWGAMKR